MKKLLALLLCAALFGAAAGCADGETAATPTPSQTTAEPSESPSQSPEPSESPKPSESPEPSESPALEYDSDLELTDDACLSGAEWGMEAGDFLALSGFEQAVDATDESGMGTVTLHTENFYGMPAEITVLFSNTYDVGYGTLESFTATITAEVTDELIQRYHDIFMDALPGATDELPSRNGGYAPASPYCVVSDESLLDCAPEEEITALAERYAENPSLKGTSSLDDREFAEYTLADRQLWRIELQNGVTELRITFSGAWELYARFNYGYEE